MSAKRIKTAREYVVTKISGDDRTRFLVDAESLHGLSDGCAFITRNHPSAEQVYQSSLSAEYLLSDTSE